MEENIEHRLKLNYKELLLKERSRGQEKAVVPECSKRRISRYTNRMAAYGYKLFLAEVFLVMQASGAFAGFSHCKGS